MKEITADILAEELRRRGVIAWADTCGDESVVVLWGMHSILVHEDTNLEIAVFCSVRFLLTLYPYWRGEVEPLRGMSWHPRPVHVIGEPWFPEAADDDTQWETEPPRYFPLHNSDWLRRHSS